MAKTIQEIQAMITLKYDAREVINEIADYIQANPGGGGGGGIESVTGTAVDDTDPLNPIIDSPDFENITTDVNIASGKAYKYNNTNILRAITAAYSYFLGPSGNFTNSGAHNIAIGFGSMTDLQDGIWNLSIGTNALNGVRGGARNIAIGVNALTALVNGVNNIAIGNQALEAVINANNNVAIGDLAAQHTTAQKVTAIGTHSAQENTTGTELVAIGVNAGKYQTTGDNNTFVGSQAGVIDDSDQNRWSKIDTNLVLLGFNAARSSAVLNTVPIDNSVGIGANSVIEKSNQVVLGNSSTTENLFTGVIRKRALDTAPASAGAAGILGEVRITATFIYVCTATNTWVRSALTTW